MSMHGLCSHRSGRDESEPAVSLPKFDYIAPRTSEEAVALLSDYGDDAIVVAGGLTVVFLLRERLIRPRVLVSLSDIPELATITVDGHLSIGATVTHSQITRSAELTCFAPLICEACGRVGSPGIRNMGTLGGSVCHGDGASDPAAALLALDAEAVVVGPKGARTVPLKDFFFGIFETALEAGEILTAVRIPPMKQGARSRFKKYTCTSVEAFAAVTVATVVEIGPNGSCTDARIGLSSIASMPMRAIRAEGSAARPETEPGIDRGGGRRGRRRD